MQALTVVTYHRQTNKSTHKVKPIKVQIISWVTRSLVTHFKELHHCWWWLLLPLSSQLLPTSWNLCKHSFDLVIAHSCARSLVHSSLPFNRFPGNSLGKKQASKHTCHVKNITCSFIFLSAIIGICVLIQFLIATDLPENSKLLLFVLRNSNEFRQLLMVGIVMAKRTLTLDESQRIKEPTLAGWQAGKQAAHTQ